MGRAGVLSVTPGSTRSVRCITICTLIWEGEDIDEFSEILGG